jgi:glycosyltransferase involved in cell wall biosynthesis
MKTDLTPKVTVLMPVYNAEKFLDEAIRSILNQTFTDFEFLIIDDGSEDRSIEIVESYDDPRIRLIRNDSNFGITSTLNRGIDLARGHFIARMDADDISYPERLEKQTKYLTENPDCALLSTWAREISEFGEPLRIGGWKSRHYYYYLIFRCVMYHPTVMFRRDAVITVGKYALPYSEDYELWNRIARKFKIASLEEVLLDYRLTETSLSRHTKREEYEQAQPFVVRSNIDYYTDYSLNLSFTELQVLVGNYNFLPGEDRSALITQCLKKWESINELILKKPNPNRDEASIREAAAETRRLMITCARDKLSLPKQLKLLAEFGEWREIRRLLFIYLRQKWWKKLFSRFHRPSALRNSRSVD